MFPLGPRQQQPFGPQYQTRYTNQMGGGFPFQNNNPFGQGQVTSPFRRGFMAPQRQQAQQAQQFYNQQPQQIPQQQIQQQQPQAQQRPRGLDALIRDENGNFDIKKVGNGVQSVMGIASQAGPLMKMLGL